MHRPIDDLDKIHWYLHGLGSTFFAFSTKLSSTLIFLHLLMSFSKQGVMKFLLDHWTHPLPWDLLLLPLLTPATLVVMAATLVVNMAEEAVAFNITSPSIAKFAVRKGTMPLFAVSITPTPPTLQMLPIWWKISPLVL